MIIKWLLLFSPFILSPSIAQKTTVLKDVLHYGGIPVPAPILCDTVNLNNEKFKTTSLLKTPLSEPTHFTVLQVGADSIFRGGKPLKGSEISLFKFYLTPSDFLPLKIEIESPNLLEVYVDGEKNTDKNSTDKSWDKASSVPVKLKADPRQYEIVVKMLVNATDSCEAMLKVSVQTEKRDSSAVFTFSSSEHRNYWTSDFLMGKKIQGVSLSPNGRFALTNFSYVYKDGSVGNCCELTDLNSGKMLWREDPNTRQLAWMPFSNTLYYTAKGFSGKELRTLDPLTQEEKVLLNDLPDGSFTWSPKESFMIYSVSETLPVEKGDLRRIINPEDRQSDFRSRNSLFLYDLKTGLKRRLTFGTDDVYLLAYSSDEKQILYSTRRAFLPEHPFSDGSLFLLTLETMKVDTIWYHDKYASWATFSPDGKKLLIRGDPNAFDGIGLKIGKGQIANVYDGQLFMMDLATRKVEALTKDFDPSVQYAQWSTYDGKIYLSAEDRDYVRIFTLDPLSKKINKLPLSPDVIGGFDLALTAGRAAYFGSTVSATGKVFTMDLKTQKEKLLAAPGLDRLALVDPVKVEDWNFKASDGTTIYGRFYLPPGFDATKKYPTLVYYYGGTSPTNRSFESNYPLNLYASMGYVVYNLQPSGTTGFGQEFSARHVNAWGDKTADEIIQGTKQFCREHAFTDSTKLGCFGASYGGFMTMYLQTKTDMFKAAVSHAGISSIASYWGEGYWGYTYSSAASSGSYPWNNPELYWDHSPLFHADKIKTPLLLLQGSVDTNVPIGESIQMFTALKILGKDVDYVRIEGENHSIRTFSRKMEWQRTILAYFARYLKSDDRWWTEMYKPTAVEK
jgi:dipeptidyl aminopeptidase/acylaminoacyl peptidase